MINKKNTNFYWFVSARGKNYSIPLCVLSASASLREKISINPPVYYMSQKKINWYNHNYIQEATP